MRNGSSLTSGEGSKVPLAFPSTPMVGADSRRQSPAGFQCTGCSLVSGWQDVWLALPAATGAGDFLLFFFPLPFSFSFELNMSRESRIEVGRSNLWLPGDGMYGWLFLQVQELVTSSSFSFFPFLLFLF